MPCQFPNGFVNVTVTVRPLSEPTIDLTWL